MYLSCPLHFRQCGVIVLKMKDIRGINILQALQLEMVLRSFCKWLWKSFLLATIYWNPAEIFMGDCHVPICVFLLFPQAHTYCISVTVAQQQRDNMSQHMWIWHRREQLVSGCYVVRVYPHRKKK